MEKNRGAYPVLRLKVGREAPLLSRHHAIFKPAVDRWPDAEDGTLVEVQSSSGEFLCYATLNKEAYVCARAVAFEKGDPLAILRRNIEQSIAMRKKLLEGEETTAFRLINAEGDGIPGLIVDQYDDILVVQYTTLGMEHLRDFVQEVLDTVCHPKGIYEKSRGFARRKEGLEKWEGWVKGDGPTEVIVKERGVKFDISLSGSQKTGLFLDQREMRSLVRRYARDRTLLDCCSYVGGFAINALLGGAKATDAVDYDAKALEKLKNNMRLNEITEERFGVYRQDVFDFLRRSPLPRPYDFIILDPPAFAKRSSDLDGAKRAYTDLNRMALAILPPSSLLLTCSCSYQVHTELFQTIIFNAARQAGRFVRIIERHRLAIDHPINLCHPEGDYLKSMLLWVE